MRFRLTEEGFVGIIIATAMILFFTALICFMLDKPIAGMCIGAISVGIFIIMGQAFKGDY